MLNDAPVKMAEFQAYTGMSEADCCRKTILGCLKDKMADNDITY
jgi:hypothetical protein